MRSTIIALALLALAACAPPADDSPDAGIENISSCEVLPITECQVGRNRECESSCECAVDGPNGEPSNGDCVCSVRCICATAP